MMIVVAEIGVTGQPGVLVADHCRIEGARGVHAQGRWRHRVGANHAELSYGDRRSYTWPAGCVSQIRWTDVEQVTR